MHQQQEAYRPSIPDGTRETPQNFDNSLRTSDRMSIDQCETIPEMDDSQLVGAPVAMVTADVDFSKRESVNTVPVVEVSNDAKIAEISTGKRKRGRPPRIQGKLGPPQAPPASCSQRKKKDEEDVCFICFDGGSLVLCDRREVIKIERVVRKRIIRLVSKGMRHSFDRRLNGIVGGIFVAAVRRLPIICAIHVHTLCAKDVQKMLIICVKSGDVTPALLKFGCPSLWGTERRVKVDFDDTTSWEYLFKVYWIYLKAKLSLTVFELTKAKNPWKGDELPKTKSSWIGAGVLAPKQEPTREFCYGTDNKGSFLDSCAGNPEAIHAKRRKMEDQPNLHAEKSSLVSEKSRIDQVMHLPEGTSWATKELLEFVSYMKNGDMSVLSQFDVQGLLQEYIKRNNLRDPNQKSHIVCDSRLIKLFGKERMGHFEMLKLLEYHFLVKEKSPADNTAVMGVSNAVCGQVEAAGNSDCQLMTGSDRRRKTRRKTDERGAQINSNPEEYAAIDVHNISLLYLKRSLMENLLDDAGKFHEKVVGSFVRIRISGGDQKQDMYRLVQVVGTGMVAESYKVGTRTTDVMLEILNLDKKEVISIDGISNQEFSECLLCVSLDNEIVILNFVEDSMLSLTSEFRMVTFRNMAQMLGGITKCGRTADAGNYEVVFRDVNSNVGLLPTFVDSTTAIDTYRNYQDECKRLRQSIKCGLIKRLMVGEIQKRAMAIQDVKVSDCLEAEILRLNHLRDRASEKGRRKEYPLLECVEKLELLKSPEERQRRLLEIPNVHADPNMNPSYESEEDAGESHKKKQGDHARRRNSSASRNGAELNSSMRGGDVLSDRGNMGQNSATAAEQDRVMCTTFYVDRDGTTLFHERVNESMQSQGGEQTELNSQNAPKNWVASTGSVTGDWNSQAIVQCGSYSGVTSSNLPPLSTGRELLVDDIETDKLWHYQDPTGKTQGPFAMVQLRKWSTSGLFPQDLRVWKINEKPNDSILLTDALVGRFHKEAALPDNSYLLAQGATVASDKDKRHESGLHRSKDAAQVDNKTVASDKDKRHESGLHQSTDAAQVDDKTMDHWKSVQSNASVDCDDNDELQRSNAWGVQSSSWTTAANVTIPNNGQAELALQLLELSKGSSKSSKALPDQSQMCRSLPSSGKPGETPSLQVKEEHEDKKGKHEGENNIGKSDDKQADSESYSNQSSGQNWRPPIKSSSSGWDSNSAFVSGDKSVETSQKNEEINFFDLPSPTPKQHLEDMKGLTGENNHSTSSKLPVLDSGPSWSTASSLVVGGARLAGVAGEWGGYSSAPVKPVEEWDSNHVSASSLKPTDGGSDHAATPTPDIDESVSDLLAEVEAMESLGGLPSPTSKLRSAEELTRGYDDDCFSPVEGFSPAPDPGKSDAFSSTADRQIPSQLTVASEALLLCHMPSQPTVLDKPLGVSLMPSQLTVVNESLRISHTPSQSTITDEPLEKSQRPSQSISTDEQLGLSQTDFPNPQKSFSEHSSTSPEVEGNMKPNDFSVNEWEKSSEIQPPASSAGNQGESGSDVQPTTPSTVSQLEAGSDVQQPTPSNKDGSQGTVKGRVAQGNTNMGWGNCHGTVQQHARTNASNSTGNPGSWGSQPRSGGDRFSGPRDQRSHFQSRDRDSGFGRDRTSWNRQPLYGVGNGGSTYRPPPKGQRVCKFYESGYCKKGASCSYWHP
ncbi:unnamed protein product [Dovyalis caffra]|uniref:Zinc finger CCCH domain-containing protein 44 n=1 Tax=Dovyalis caffra TaxID=77055 RepID=A0AAV1RDS8_9ROSI|nr:unnamed protein product [Dovyalis caffra]